MSYQDTPTRAVSVNGRDFVYRQLSPDGGVPIVFLNHLAGIALAERLPHSQLTPLYPDAGHGGIFQNHEQFVRETLEFLTR
jgi:pimeloyl-ACP methyl ester carboxylesterase